MSPPAGSPACLVVFAKTPVRGSVKTRMQPYLSEHDCLRLHKALLKFWIAHLRDWELGSVQKTLFLTPLDDHRAEADLDLGIPEGVAVETQHGGDLGERLTRALHQKWNDGFRKLLFIGTDCPLLGIEDLQSAFQALDEYEVVLGPASDGGYYLIGISSLRPELFSRISWGTPDVYRQTVERLQAGSIDWKCLREVFDLDTFEDLVTFHRFVKESPSAFSGSAEQELTGLVAGLVAQCSSAPR